MNVTKRNRAISLIMTMVLLIVSSTLPVFATQSPSMYKFSNYNPYAQKATENVNVDGVMYSYYYYYDDNGNRAISITNNADSTVDLLTYNETESKVYLNDAIVGTVTKNIKTPATVNYRAIQRGWTKIGSDSDYISWRQGVTIAVVAGVISIGLGSLGVAGVITAMGTASIGVIAACSGGGTLYMDYWRYFNPPAPTMHQCEWSFTASTGDQYGTYLYLY